MKIGIDLGGSHIAIGVVNNRGLIVEKVEKRLTKIEKHDIKKSIEDYIIENVLKLIEKYDIQEIGLAVPGVPLEGTTFSSGNLGINDYNIVEKLKEKIKLPIRLQNDAKCAAIAENKHGCLKDYNRSVFLTLGTGIGGAAFLDNKLLKAGMKPGFEFGHMVIQKDGIQCTCGRKGCFERYASMKALKNNLRTALNLDEKTSSQELLDIIKKSKPEDKNYELIQNVISEYIENLSIGIVNLVNIFEPEVIGIGGSFAYFEDVFLTRLKQQIKVECSKIFKQDIEIKIAILGNDAGIIGAVC